MFIEPPVPAVLLLMVFGMFANTSSYTYFITSNRTTTKRVKLGNELLCLLSCSDFLICLLAYPNFSYPGVRFSVVHSCFILPFQTLAEYSVWVTAMISFTRMYLILFPLRQLNRKIIHSSNLAVFVIMLGYYAVLEFMDLSSSLYFNLIYILLVRVSLIISSSIVCGVVSIRSLRATKQVQCNTGAEIDGMEKHRHAAITVLLLVSVSSFLNAFPIPPLILIILKQHPEGLRAFFSSLPFLTVPLNSAINPVIYFLRNAEMRATYARQCRRVIRSMERVFCPQLSTNEMRGEDNHFEMRQTIHSNM